MINLGSKLRHSLLILGLILLAGVIALSMTELGIIPIDNSESRDDLRGENISVVSLPEILVGGSEGDIYLVDQNSKPEFVGNVDDDIQDIGKSGNQIFVATIRDNAEDEELGTSNGRLLKFNQNQESFVPVDRIFSSPDKTVEIGGQLLDLEIVGDKILTASHSHDSTSETDEGSFYEGKLTIIDKETLQIDNEIGLPGASDVKVYSDSVLAYGVGPKAIVLDKNSLTVRNELQVDGTIAGVEKQDEHYFFTSSREYVETGVPNPPTVEHGYISKHSQDGEEIATIDTGITSRPREITAYGDELMVVNDFAKKSIKFVDFYQNKVIDTIKLGDKPEDLTVSDNQAYAIGSEDDVLYVIDLESRTLENKININGISSISSY